MTMASLGTLTVANPTSTVVAWAGGQGLFSTTGTMITQGDPCVCILECDDTGVMQPAGDAVLHTSPAKITFFLPPCNIQVRCVTPDSNTSVEVFVS